MSDVTQSTTAHGTSTGHHLASSDWLDVHFLAMQPEYEEMLRWVGLQPGWHVLDAACGNGSFLPLMTELVGPQGQVSALDLAPENIAAVEARARGSSWPAPVVTRVGDILALPYADQSFDAVWCANTSQYLTDDELRTMLAEFRRVVRPGGLVAIKEFDVTDQQIQPTTPTLFIHWHEAMCRSGDAYHCQLLCTINLAQWLRAAGLVDLRQKPTLMVRVQPLRAVERQLICDFMKFAYTQAQKADLPATELALFRQYADTEAPDHITNHPDFLYRAVQTVFVGRVP
jgi:SAM-dependent methyltransferase